jgi:hypothetical protein
MYSGEARHAPVAYQIAIVKDIRTIQEHKANAHLVSPFTAMAYDDLGEDMEIVLGNVLHKTKKFTVHEEPRSLSRCRQRGYTLDE